MSDSLRKELQTTVDQLVSAPPPGVSRDFTTDYLRVRELHRLTDLAVKKAPEVLGHEALRAYDQVLSGTVHEHQKNARHYYREAAEGLCGLLRTSVAVDIVRKSLSILRWILATPGGKARMATAFAMSNFGADVVGCEPAVQGQSSLVIHWEELLRSAGREGAEVSIAGRSLLVHGDDDILVVKLARLNENVDCLCNEASWMEAIASFAEEVEERFDIPKPLHIAGGCVFRLQGIPDSLLPDEPLHPEGAAMAYVAHSDYFHYPNGPAPENLLSPTAFRECLSRNAFLLGWLACRGILHTAVVPLFHNRVQHARRSDDGLYDWRRMGRLDQWLRSCLYPNIGMSGLRDFEHFETVRCGAMADSVKGPADEYFRHCGNHVLGLLLIAGSWFRMHEPELIGLCGECPVDARHLFDLDYLEGLIREIHAQYYLGFTGTRFTGEAPGDLRMLATRMREEMGVDRYMREILRVEDQDAMSNEAFLDFLCTRGLAAPSADGSVTCDYIKGEADLEVLTGPHLGDFNQTASLPEILEFSAAATGSVFLGRHLVRSLPLLTEQED